MGIEAYCQRCGFRMEAHEYWDYDNCPACGQGFSFFYYRTTVYTCILIALIGWILHWIESTSTSLAGTILLSTFCFGNMVLAIIIDQLLKKVTLLQRKSRESKGSWIAIIAMLIIVLTLSNFVVNLSKL